METWSPDPLIAKANHENKLAEMLKLDKMQKLQLALAQVSIIARSYHWLALSLTKRVSHSCCQDLTDVALVVETLVNILKPNLWIEF